VSKLKANRFFNRANHNFSTQRYRLAIEDYERALENNPDLIQAYHYLGESYKNLYRPGVADDIENDAFAQRALDALNKALEIEPENKQIIHSLGDMYDRMRNFEEAEKMFLKVLEMEPTNMENYYVVAGFYKRYSGEREELKKRAESMYLRRIETDPDNPQGYAYLAQLFDEATPMPDFDRALEVHKMRLKLQPDDFLGWYAIGVNRFYKAYRLQNTLSIRERIAAGNECEEALKKALDLEPSYSFTYSYLGLVYLNVFAKVYPEKEQSYIQQSNTWLERFREVRAREQERERLEKELQRGEVR
jgi:tetratricopeptide (TPR) repeat protein